jgi:hypothetical protein
MDNTATEDLYIIFLSIMVVVNLKCVKVDNHFTLPVFSSIMKLDFLTSTHNFLVQERDMM